MENSKWAWFDIAFFGLIAVIILVFSSCAIDKALASSEKVDTSKTVIESVNVSKDTEKNANIESWWREMLLPKPDSNYYFDTTIYHYSYTTQPIIYREGGTKVITNEKATYDSGLHRQVDQLFQILNTNKKEVKTDIIPWHIVILLVIGALVVAFIGFKFIRL